MIEVVLVSFLDIFEKIWHLLVCYNDTIDRIYHDMERSWCWVTTANVNKTVAGHLVIWYMFKFLSSSGVTFSS